MSLLQSVLRSIAESSSQPHQILENVDDDDVWINVTSTPGSPYPTRPSSPTHRHLRSAPVLTSVTPRRDPLRLLPTEICQRIFGHLSLSDLANCTLVCRKWWRSQTLNYVWFQHYRRENFVDTSLPPGKWTKRESKQNWRVLHLKSLSESERATPQFSRASMTESANRSGYQTPKEMREEQWEVQASHKLGKQEMRELYKELGGRKAKNKLKLGSTGVRDKGGWAETSSEWYST